MAHFAKIQEDGIVETVVVINNSDILDIEGNESEEVGIAFCKSLYMEKKLIGFKLHIMKILEKTMLQ